MTSNNLEVSQKVFMPNSPTNGRSKTTKCFLPLTIALACMPVCVIPACSQTIADPLFAVSPKPVGEAASVDEFLLSLSQSLKVNALADVTHVSSEPLVQPYPGSVAAKLGMGSRERDYWLKSTGETQLVDLMGQRHLSLLRYNPQTLLFWREPPLIPLSKRILAERGELWKNYGDGKPPAGSTSWRRYWEEFLREQGWDGVTEDVDIQVKLADLPPETSNQILYQIWMERFRRDEQDLLTEAGWATAKLVKCQASDSSGKSVEYLGVKIFSVPPDPLPYGYTPMPVIMLIGKLATENTIIKDIQIDIPELVDDYALGSKQNDGPVAAELNQDNPQAFAQAELDEDPKLSGAINLQAKRISLDAMLAELAKQSGITFETIPAVKAQAQTKLVVAQFSEMPIRDIMSALSRLYGLRWQSKVTGYTMDFSRENWTRQQLRQVGDPAFYRAGWLYRPADSVQSGEADFAAQLKAGLGEAELGPVQVGEIAFSDQHGVPVSKLPVALQTRLRQFVEVKVSTWLPKSQIEANSVFKNSPDLVLRFRREKSPLLWSYHANEGETTISSSDKFFGDSTERYFAGSVFRFTIVRPDGELVCPIFSRLDFEPKPK